MSAPAEFIDLDPETLQAQRTARNAVRRDSLIMLAVFLLLFVLWMFLFPSIAIYLPFPIPVLVLLLMYGLFKLVINWRGWAALIKYNLHCPHCKRPLAEKVNLFKSPNRQCPHCGKTALAPIRQLMQRDA